MKDIIHVEYVYRGVSFRVVDGDTIRIDFDLGLGVWRHNQEVRLLDVHAPEMTGEGKAEGLAAKVMLLGLLPAGTDVVVQTFRDKNDKYGRYVAQVWRSSDGLDINEHMRTKAPVGGR